MNIRNYINRAKDGIITSVVVLSCVLFWSCSFSDDLATTALEPDVAADQTVLAVTLSGDDGPMLISATNQTADNTVNNVHFYFYDNDGNYITQGEIDPDNDTDWKDGSDDNVEIENDTDNGKYFIILEGLTGTPDTNKPWYVVTILNQPTSFERPYHLEEMLSVMSEGSNSGIGSTTANEGLVMSTSTYIPVGNVPYSGAKYQFYTPIYSTNFGTSLSDAEAKGITIPVERLAAKVTVKLADGLSTSTITGIVNGTSGSHTVYQSSDDDTRYIELLGWKLNAVARGSNMFKNLDEDWVTSAPWSGWNDPTNTRCYWAKSIYYGESTPAYPEEGENNDNTPDDEDDSNSWLSPYVKYVSLGDDYDSELLTIGVDDAYCPENTNGVYNELSNPSGVIEDHNSTCLTSVLIKARAWGYDSSTDTYSPLSGVVGNDEGLMYYSIPIQHDASYTSGTIVEGTYGVVRNHHYTLTITGVEHLGNVILEDDLDEVIVPTDVSPTSLTGLSALWSNHKEETVNNGDNEFIDKTIEDD